MTFGWQEQIFLHFDRIPSSFFIWNCWNCKTLNKQAVKWDSEFLDFRFVFLVLFDHFPTFLDSTIQLNSSFRNANCSVGCVEVTLLSLVNLSSSAPATLWSLTINLGSLEIFSAPSSRKWNIFLLFHNSQLASFEEAQKAAINHSWNVRNSHIFIFMRRHSRNVRVKMKFFISSNKFTANFFSIADFFSSCKRFPSWKLQNDCMISSHSELTTILVALFVTWKGANLNAKQKHTNEMFIQIIAHKKFMNLSRISCRAHSRRMKSFSVVENLNSVKSRLKKSWKTNKKIIHNSTQNFWRTKKDEKTESRFVPNDKLINFIISLNVCSIQLDIFFLKFWKMEISSSWGEHTMSSNYSAESRSLWTKVEGRRIK